MIEAAEALKTFLGLLAIVNPLGAVPVFLAVTDNLTPSDRIRSARIAAVTVAVVLVLSMLAGQAVLRFFGIGIPSFTVAGGILILLMAVNMLNAQPGRLRSTSEEQKEAEEKDTTGVAVAPIAIPVLSGPGAIGTVILQAHQAQSTWQWAVLAASIAGVCGLTWISLRAAEPVGRWLGRTGINIFTRLMGMILAAIAIEFIARGLLVLVPGLN